MIQKFTAGNGANLALAEEQAKTGKFVLASFVGGAAFLALGAGAAYMAVGGGEPAAPSTAQQIAVLTSPEPAPTHTTLVASERRGLRYRPGAENEAAATAAPVAIATAAPDLSEAPMDLEQIVSRSMGTAASDPIGLQAAPAVAPALPAPATEPVAEQIAVPAPEVVPEAVAEPVPEAAAVPVAAQIAPAELFTAPAAVADNRCIDDLRNLMQDARVYFPSGGLNVDEQGIAQARLIGFVAQNCPGVMVQVEGHSDASGDPAINLRLSEQRAQTVIQRLGASGVDTSMFQAVGFGDQRPSGLSGTQPAAYYDRRVEFSVVEVEQVAQVTLASAGFLAAQSACIAPLQQAADQTRLFFEPGSITVAQSELSQVYQLAAAAAACPTVRLRVVGQFSDDPGSSETPATARMRALALRTTLVASGFDAERILVGAPSSPTLLADAPGISERRIDFDVIVDGSL